MAGIDFADEEKPSLGSKIMDILAGAAEGYSSGAGNGNFAEAAFARGFSGGYKGGKAREKEQNEEARASRLRSAISRYKDTPDYASLSEKDRTLYDVAPEKFLEREPKSDDRLDEATSAAILETFGVKPQPGQRLSKAAGDKLTVLAGMKERKTMAQQAAQDRKAIAEERAEQRKAMDEDRQTKAFSKTIEDLGIPEAVTQLKAVAKFLPKEGDVPGFGPLASLTPTRLAGKDAKSLRQAVAGLQNVKIKDRSGAAVTPPEFERLQNEFGSGLLKTEGELRQGLTQALQAYQERLRNAFAGVRPEVRDRYFQNQDIDNYLETIQGLDFGGAQAVPAPNGITKAYASEAEAQAAEQAGQLKPGDRVTIGGQPGTWE